MARPPIGLLLVVLTSPLAAQPPRPLPTVSADNVLSIHSVVGGEQPEWSPDGRAIMFQSSLGGVPGLWGVSPDGGFPTRLAPNLGTVPYQSNYLPQWSPAGDWIAYTSAKSGATEIWLWSPLDGRDIQLTRLGQTRINSMSWAPDGKSLVFAGDRYGSYDIWTVTVAGDVSRLTTDGRYEVFPTFLPNGRTIVYVQLDARWVDHEIVAMPATGGPGKVITKDSNFFDYGAGRTFGYPMPSPDGNWILFRSHRSGWINYWLAPTAGGEARQLAAEPSDQSNARWSPDGKWVSYLGNRNGTQDLRVVAAAGGTPKIVVAPKGQGMVANPAWSPDGTKIGYTLGTPTEAPELYTVAVATGATRQLTQSAPGGNVAAAMVMPEKITYQSGAHQISAYLYQPANIAPGERLPAIMYIHGGPTAQFSDNYQAQVQFFVQQGYVLLLPNIRGSSGYGRAFEDANDKDWGHGDLDDVKAGAEYLKRLNYVNAARVGITGTSYGGCMTMAATAFAPGFFQAAIAAAGYGDWIDFYGEQEYRHVKLLDYEFGPLSPATEAIYRRSSPYFQIAQIQTPIMLVHGVGRFPNSHASKTFAAELERYYKVFRYETYPNENYYVNNSTNQRRMFLEMLEFFDQYLKDGASGKSAVATGSGR